MATEGWATKTNTILVFAGFLFTLFVTVATVAMYQGRIEEKVTNVDKRLERMESKLDLIAPPTVRPASFMPPFQSLSTIANQPVASQPEQGIVR
jgi:hypothetical protein